MLDKSIKIVGRVGDIDPLNDGGVILDHGDGRPTLAYLVSCEDGPERRRCSTCGIEAGTDVVCCLSFELFRVDILNIEEDVLGAHHWASPHGVARSCGMRTSKFVELVKSENLRDKAQAIVMVAGYYGWENFDSYPVRMDHDEAQDWADEIEEREKKQNS